MKVEFTVEGMAKGKERPRVARVNGHTHAYTPKTTKDYEQQVKAAYPGFKYDDDAYLSVFIVAYYPTPKASKIRTRMMLSGRLRPTRRPDLDNIAKSICDALNGTAYKDDSQIIRLTVEKWYSTYPRVEVRIEDVKW